MWKDGKTYFEESQSRNVVFEIKCAKKRKNRGIAVFQDYHIAVLFFLRPYDPIFSIWASLIFLRRIFPTLDFGNSSVK